MPSLFDAPPAPRTEPIAAPTLAGSLSLRPYQEAALLASAQRFEAGINRQGLSMATGTGKTVVFTEQIRRRGGHALILAHRDELIGQAVKKMRMVAPGTSVGVVKAERDQVFSNVVVGSVQTLQNPRRLRRLRGPFSTIVVDEAHHAAAASYRSIIEELMTDETLLLGVSATWDRADKKGLDSLFDEIVYEYDLLTAIMDGYLSDIRAMQVQLAVDFKGLKVVKGDYAATDSERLLDQANAPTYALKAYQEHAAGRRAVLFAPTVASAKGFARVFADAGISTGSVWGEQDEYARKAALSAFHDGRIQVLTNCAVLTEGFDEPAVDCVIVARPTKSRSLYTQMVGRGTRLYPGKEDCLVLDLVGATTRHELMTAASLLGADPGALAKKGIAQLKEEEQRKAVIAASRGKATGPTIETPDLFEDEVIEGARVVSKHVDLFRHRDLHWGSAAGVFTLGMGDGVLTVREKDSGWEVLLVPTKGDQSRQVIAGGLDLGYAQGFAEDYAREHGVKALVDPQAPWRTKPISEKQMALLNRYRIPLSGITTAGDASDRISAAMATRGGKR